jgi:hypothetical protein
MASNNVDPSPYAVASQATSHQRAANFKLSAANSKLSACSGSKKTKTRIDFHPSDYSVICGRGKNTYNHIGNRRYRIIASMFIERYSRAATKTTKSAIVSEIITLIRQLDGNFWKLKGGTWFAVEENYAREKVGASLRDLLHSTYRSSSKAKIARRRTQKTRKRKENQEQATRKAAKREETQDHQSDQKQVEDARLSDDCSTTSSSWGSTQDSLGFEYWLEDDFFDIDVF